MKEPCDYVSGYICKKLQLEPSEEVKSDSWISTKSEGKLVTPKKELCDLIKKCDKVFEGEKG